MPHPPYATVWTPSVRYRTEVPTRKRLTTRDWTAAALAALARGGIAAVAVEPIAASLGATKGSFYWHFDSRDALLEAALREWERTDTDDVIALVEAEPDVRRRLRTLLTVALGGHPGRPGERVVLALLATADHPLVAPVLARVTSRRLGYLTGLFSALGFPPGEARQRSLLAYTAYLGHAQLAHATPEAAPAGDALPAYVDTVITTLTAR
jgi:AcrR family transcriptional regulator